jgi:hypothetical protein
VRERARENGAVEREVVDVVERVEEKGAAVDEGMPERVEEKGAAAVIVEGAGERRSGVEPGEGVAQRTAGNGVAVEEGKGAKRRDDGIPSNGEQHQRS